MWLKSICQKFVKEFNASALLAGTVFFFAPLSVFVVNESILKTTLKEALWFYFQYTLIAWIVLFSISILFRKISQYFVVLYIGLTLAFIIQGNFLLYNLGTLNGSAIQWSNYYKYIPFEIILWAGCIAIPFFFRKTFYQNLNFIAALCLLVNIIPILGSVASNSVSFASGSAASTTYYDNSKEFEFSADKNVVVIVLDTFRSDAFSEIIKSDPEFAKDFKDFTFFTNQSAGYPTTEPSIPLMLTGVYNDNTMPVKAYMAANREKSLPYFLSQRGVRTEVYSFTQVFFDDWENKTSTAPGGYQKAQIDKELFATFIRYLPLPFKAYFAQQYYTGFDYFHKDISTFSQNAALTTLKDKPAVFKFIHLSGAHPPYQQDGSFNRVDKGYLEQAKASLHAADMLLKEMKSTGAYDNSLIIILGDHGFINPTLRQYDQVQSRLDERSYAMPDGIISQANSLLLAKNFNQQKDAINVSSAPVSIMDIPKTIADTLRLKNDYEGYSIFKEIPNDRVRKFYYYQWEHLDWNKPYLPAMYEFDIHGNVTDSSSWKFSYKVSDEKETIDLNFPKYIYGVNLVSSIFNNEVGYLFSPGFEMEGTSYSWGVGPVACTNLLVIPSQKFLSLSIKGTPFIASGFLDKQNMVVTIDQQQVASLQNASETNVIIQPDDAEKFTLDGKIHICFEFPDAQPLKDLGVTDDERPLAYRFTDISLSEVGDLTLPVDINLKKSGNDVPTQIQLSGFSDVEEQYTWTDEREASVKFPVQKNSKNIVFEFSATPFLEQGKINSQKVIVQANGHDIKELTIDQFGEFSVTIPAQYVTDMVDIKLEIPTATSPFDLGMGKDKRILGLAVQWIRIREEG